MWWLRWLFVALLLAGSPADAGMLGGKRALLAGSSFNASSSQSAAFIARTAGLSTKEKKAYDAMISGMVADGTWTLLDTLYIFATNTQTTALLNLISTSFTGTTNGTVSFSTDHGYTGDGATFFIDTGWKPTNGPNYTQNSAAYGVYILTSSAVGVADKAIGESAGANFDIDLTILNPSNNLVAQINDPAGDISQANGNYQGSWGVIRTAVAATAVYKNGALFASGVATSGVPAGFNVFLFSNNPTGGSFLGKQMSAAFTGGGMTTAQLQQVQSRINGYMTALGINVY